MKLKVRKFFFESFRKHDKSEYAEVFSRGIKDNEGENNVYPWLWLRVLGVLAIAYTVYAVINAALPGAGDREVFYFLGGAFLDVAFLVLLFELYPKRDLSLVAVLCVCVAGGCVSDFISAIVYHFHSFEVISNGWKLAAIAGVSEEIAKAVPAVICVLILKKKDNAAAGFLIGAAVGTWFSITENASYIHSGSMGGMILTATARAFGCMFSHAVWTALITRAFCKYGLKGYKFYLIVLINMALHFCIDMPLYDSLLPVLFTEAAVCGLCALIWSITVIHRDRRIIPLTESGEIVLTYAHKKSITMSAFLFCMCAVLLVFSALYSNTYKIVTKFTKDEFTEFAHDGYSFEIDKERKFEENYDNYLEQYEKGELKLAYQQVGEGEVSCLYCYRFSPVLDDNGEPVTYVDEDGKELPLEEMQLSRVDVIITLEGEEFRYYPHSVIVYDEFFEYYPINPALDEGRVNFDGDNVNFIVTHDGWDLKTIISFSACAAVAAGWVATYIIMKKKKADD